MSKNVKVSSAKMHDRASLALVKGDLNTAEIWLEKALEENERDATALAMLANIYLKRDDTQTALGLILLAIAEKPDELVHLEIFISCVSRMSFSFTAFNASIANAVEVCLQRDDVNVMRLGQLWHALLSCHPELADLADPGVSFESEKIARLAVHPFFLAGLGQLMVQSRQFETMLVKLRAALRDDLVSKTRRWTDEEFLRVAAALSHYNFFTEYILDTTPEEDIWVEEQRKKMTDVPQQAGAAVLALFSCYDSLGNIPDASVLADVFDGHAILKPVIDLQIGEAIRQSKIKDRIPSATAIEDSVSEQVRDMYEAFPYPRWRYLPQNLSRENAEAGVPARARILVAGCGTGHESATIAKAFPDADITAIDLSKSSLAYAAARAEDMGLSHVSFAQGDILRLDPDGEKYDYIVCTGVLHHMKDPVAGWRALRNLLKPKGLMRIGLYSEAGRRDIAQARAVISSQGYGVTRKDMKAFRRNAADALPADVLASLQKRMDYYQASMLCDLLFHVQEHRFDLGQIRKMLDELALQHVEMKLQADGLLTYREKYGARPFSADLADWQKIEEELPDIFRSMYVFWCRAKT